MSFRDRADMFTPRCAQPLTPHHYAYVPTTTARDWSVFDRPAIERVTSRRVRPERGVLTLRRQAS